MASTKEHRTSKGLCYEISVSRGRGKSPCTKRWYVPKEWTNWSAKKKNTELEKQKALFELECKENGFRTQKETKAIEEKERLEKVTRPTLKEYVDTVFIPQKTVTASSNTIDTWSFCLKNHIYPAMGDCILAEITSQQITAFLLQLQSDGKLVSTAIKHYGLLKLIFKSAYNADLIVKNPMGKVSRPVPTKGERQNESVSSYTIEEVKAILKALEKEPLQWRTFVKLMIDTGMRNGECCGLMWEDINFDTSEIIIRHNLQYTSQKGVELTTTKSGKERTIDIAPEVLTLIKALKAHQDAECSSPYVFTQRNSENPIHPSSPRRYLKKFGERNGIENLHPHKLRHTMASIAITSGADVESVSEKLGHADAGFTLRQYTHANKDTIKKAGDIFRDALKEK